MLKAVVNFKPGIAAFTSFYYSKHSQLFYDKIMKNCSAVKVVFDKATHWALGFFSDALADYVENSGIIARASTTFLVSRRRCLLGSEDNLIRFCNLPRELGPDRGLHARVDKRELQSPVNLGTLYIETKRIDISGLEVLGAEVGSPEFVCMKFNKKIGKTTALFEKLDYMDDHQCALSILRHYIGGPQNDVIIALSNAHKTSY